MTEQNLLPPARVLGLETSRDETAAAVLEDGRILHSSVVATQMDLHAQFGGVFPGGIPPAYFTIHPVVDQALHQAHLSLSTWTPLLSPGGPGLAGSLVVGMNIAKGLALASGLPLIGVNHLEGHIYSAWINPPDAPAPPEPEFPLLALLVSGGHTELNPMKGHVQYQRLAQPWMMQPVKLLIRSPGCWVCPIPARDHPSRRRRKAETPRRFAFPRARLDGTWDFSFSGLKTAVLRVVRQLEGSRQPLPVSDLAASFQAVAG